MDERPIATWKAQSDTMNEADSTCNNLRTNLTNLASHLESQTRNPILIEHSCSSRTRLVVASCGLHVACFQHACRRRLLRCSCCFRCLLVGAFSESVMLVGLRTYLTTAHFGLLCRVPSRMPPGIKAESQGSGHIED